MKQLFLCLFLYCTVNLFGETALAVADIRPTQGNQAEGRVIFQQEGGAVRVVAHLKGLKPGLHGFHIHEKGDCSAADASSAGGHFNPHNEPHGAPDDAKRHVGDLGNIMANENGEAFYERVDFLLTLNGPASIIGRGVIVHADPDDFVTQPTGNAGGRVGCGVIRAVK
jgi:Cu-Zn family superoxide dismutase